MTYQLGDFKENTEALSDNEILYLSIDGKNFFNVVHVGLDESVNGILLSTQPMPGVTKVQRKDEPIFDDALTEFIPEVLKKSRRRKRLDKVLSKFGIKDKVFPDKRKPSPL